jgi:cell division protein ZapE
VAGGELKPDPAQAGIAARLDQLHRALGGYRPMSETQGWRSLLKRTPKVEPPRGLYIHGGVGRGKSMLMDLFFAGAPVEKKRRVHFHAFMAEIHRRLHTLRQATKGSQTDPLPLVAGEVAAETWLLCFDEFVVYDIADAMILGRLFPTLFAKGVVVVATSNFAPRDLYKDGLQRDRFEPFIKMIGETLEVLPLDGPTDYRLARLAGRPVYHWPLDRRAHEALARDWADLTDGAEGVAEEIRVMGRKVPVPRAAHGVARFDFEDLCARPLGASDYLAIAARYHTVILDGVPTLSAANHNEARRFITLIDALYEAKTKMILAAAAPAERLYPEGRGAFEFTRTVSRLMEMQSADYWALEPAVAAE